MLARKFRLTKPGDFARVYAVKNSWANRWLVLYKAPNELDISRFGFSASRRIGSAVVRNRAKRLMREAVRKQLDQVSPGWDIVFIARKDLVNTGYGTAEQAVRHLLQLAQLVRPAEVSAQSKEK